MHVRCLALLAPLSVARRRGPIELCRPGRGYPVSRRDRLVPERHRCCRLRFRRWRWWWQRGQRQSRWHRGQCQPSIHGQRRHTGGADQRRRAEGGAGTVAVSGTPSVTQSGTWQMSLSAGLPAGANAIGSVSVSNLPATQAISAASLPLSGRGGHGRHAVRDSSAGYTRHGQRDKEHRGWMRGTDHAAGLYRRAARRRAVRYVRAALRRDGAKCQQCAGRPAGRLIGRRHHVLRRKCRRILHGDEHQKQ